MLILRVPHAPRSECLGVAQTAAFDAMTQVHGSSLDNILQAVLAINPGLLDLTNATGCIVTRDKQARAAGRRAAPRGAELEAR